MIWNLFVLGLFWMSKHTVCLQIGDLEEVTKQHQLGRTNDPCPYAPALWESADLAKSGFSVQFSRAPYSTWFGSFCCCRSKGMRMLSPRTLDDMKNLYADLVAVGLFKDTVDAAATGVNVCYLDFHGYGSAFMNVYGEDDIPELQDQLLQYLGVNGFEPNKIFIASHDNNSFVHQKASFRSGYPEKLFRVWYMCTDHINDPNSALKDIDKYLTDVEKCNEESIKQLAITAATIRIAPPPQPCPAPIPCTTPAPTPTIPPVECPPPEVYTTPASFPCPAFPACPACPAPSASQSSSASGSSNKGCKGCGNCGNGGWWPLFGK